MAGEEEEAAEKPFEATPRKLEEARKRGEVPISQDLVTFGVYCGVLLTAAGFGAWSFTRSGEALVPLFSSPDILAESVFQQGRYSLRTPIWNFTKSLLVWFVLPSLVALLAAYSQGALVLATTKPRPKLSRISPIRNAKQKYGPDGVFNFLKSSCKLIVYSLALFVVFRYRIEDILSLPTLRTYGIIKIVADICFQLLLIASSAIFIFAILDYGWQRTQFLKRQRMTLKELKDESKETEGDPYTKQARRQKGYDIATNKMLIDTQDADVIVVNPEHYAVALKWSRLSGTAPVCVAKGIDAVADRIRNTGIEHGVPIYRDPPTARAIFSLVGLGDEIPTEHYRAIAAAIRFADAIKEKARNP